MYPILPGDSGEDIRTLKGVDLTAPGPQPYVELWMTPVTKISGRVTDAQGESVVEAGVTLARLVWSQGQYVLANLNDILVVTDADGFYSMSLPVSAGNYFLKVVPGSLSQAFPPQYYPGVSHPEQQSPVRISPGVDLSGMCIRFETSTQSSVRFGLKLRPGLPETSELLSDYLGLGESPLSAQVRRLGAGRIEAERFRIGVTFLGEDVWELEPLGAGAYELLLRYSPALTRAFPDLNWEGVGTIGLFQLSVDSTDGDQIDLGTIAPGQPISIPGRVIFPAKAGAGTPFPEFSFFSTGFPGPRLYATPAPDGTFRMSAWGPEVFDFVVPPLTDGWYVASVRSGARDVLKDGLDIGRRVGYGRG